MRLGIVGHGQAHILSTTPRRACNVRLLGWEQRKAEVCQDISEIERRAKAIQQKLDRLDEAFLFAESIDIDTYDRHKDKLRQELTLLQIDQHADQLEKFDGEGILAFAERVLPRASDLWYRHRSRSDSACSSCFSLMEWCSTERALFEPG